MPKCHRAIVAFGLLGAAVLVVVSGGIPEAAAAKNPSAKCRATIGKTSSKAVGAALKSIAQCHAKRLKSGQAGDCNLLGAGTPAGGAFSRGKAQAVARIKSACKDGDPVLANYGDAPTTDLRIGAMFDRIAEELETSATDLQSSPSFQGQPDAKQRGKCHGSIGKGRTGVVQAIVGGAVRCQARLDKSATSFGPIAAECVGGAGGAGSKASSKIAKACGSLSGVEVGSCPSLPNCAVTAAEATGQRIARLLYGGPAVCGNGVEDLGEECDDGNTVEDDGCRASCLLPTCGDFSRNQPSEECDDQGPGGGMQTRNGNCFECRNNVCGDGNVDTQEPRIEACDDGNTTPGDGCTDCQIDGATCGAEGIGTILSLELPTGSATILVGSADLRMSYPGEVQLPGTSPELRGRVTRLIQGVSLGSVAVNDTDNNGTPDAFDVSLGGGSSSAPPLDGALLRVQFGCTDGTALDPQQFPCAVAAAFDREGRQLTPTEVSQLRCVVGFDEGPPPTTTTTVTTSSTIPSSTTTTLPPALCGNSPFPDDTLDPGEDCDDGNTQNFDDCPSDCTVETCTETTALQTATVHVDNPGLQAVTLELVYPMGQVAVRGAGFGADVVNLTAGLMTAVDFDGSASLRIVVSTSGEAFDQSPLAELNFLACQEATGPLVPSQVSCVARDASLPGGTPVPATCFVTVP